MAHKDAGLIQEGEVPSSEQYAEAVLRLQDIVGFWQTQGLKLFLLTDYAVPLVLGQALYSFGPAGTEAMQKPLRILQAYFLDTNGVQTPLVCLSWDEYLRLSQVNQQGSINSYFVDKQITELNLKVWPTPDATAVTGTVHVLLEQSNANFNSLTNDASTYFPTEWFMGLRWALADELATGQPQSIMDRCEKRAQLYRVALEDWDREDASTFFTVDARMSYQGGWHG
jgi:hypothetical protein